MVQMICKIADFKCGKISAEELGDFYVGLLQNGEQLDRAKFAILISNVIRSRR
jgi:hypothetical protein